MSDFLLVDDSLYLLTTAMLSNHININENPKHLATEGYFVISAALLVIVSLRKEIFISMKLLADK